MPSQNPPFLEVNQQIEGMNSPSLSITWGRVSPDDNSSAFLVPSKPGIMTDYMIHSGFEKDHHVYMLGITSPQGFQGDSVAFVQLAAPTMLYVVRWTASRWGQIPKAPDPYMIGNGRILMDEHYDTVPILVNAGGQVPLYRWSGVFIFGAKAPKKRGVDEVSFPRHPDIADVFNRVPSEQENMDSTLLTPNGGMLNPKVPIK